jgi:hypothetical protein
VLIIAFYWMRFGRFTFAIAEPGQREAVLEVRRAVYGEELGYGETATEWADLDNRAIHLLAFLQGEPIATMRLLGPNARPFELETSLNLSPFLRSNHPPGEITRFCITPTYRKLTRGLPMHVGLMRLLYDACRMNEIEDVFICAKENTKRLYEFALYEPLTPANIRYRPLGGTLHLLMRLHIPTLAARYKELNHPLKAAFEPSTFTAEGNQ